VPGRSGRGRQRVVQIQPEALDDLKYWVDHDRKIAARVLELIESARQTPFEGFGKPEPLRHLGSDVWSRRITRADRLVYRVLDACIDVLQARFHY
jgi:toxin YoeB